MTSAKLVALCTLPLLGDVTVRYQTSMKEGPTSTQLKPQLDWGEFALRMKNGKEWSSVGPWMVIVDCTTQQMTLIDTISHSFSHLAVSELPAKMAAQNPQPSSEAEKRALPEIKTTVDSKKTGRTDTILGIQAEEREFNVSIAMIVPAASWPDAVNLPAMTTRMVLQVWTARPEEVSRNQAIRELAGYKLWTNYFMNPARVMEAMSPIVPDSAFVKSMAEVNSGDGGVMLRTHVAIYISMPQEVRRKLEGNPAVAVDPDAPMFEMMQEAVEVSSAPVEDSLYRIPAEYQEIAPEAILNLMVQRQMAAMGPPQKP